MAAWLTLSTSYDISTVCAVLTFLLSLVSAAGIWIVSYAYWKAGASRALQSRSGTELLSLFSMAGVVDAIDALGMISREMSCSLLLRLVLQAVAVVALAVLGVLSGPVAQWSTRKGTQVEVRPVSGWLATPKHFANMPGDPVLWNMTIERRRAAEFPLDRLFDFLPDNDVEWVFHEEEWQNTMWSARCTWTPLTAIYDVVATGNHSGDITILDKLPVLRSAIPDPTFLQSPFYTVKWDEKDNKESEQYRMDALIEFIAQTNPLNDFFDPSTGLPLVDATGKHISNFATNSAPLNLTLAVVRLRHIPSSLNSSSSSLFGSGAVGSAAFTRADCYVMRAIPLVDRDGVSSSEDDWSAYPWTTRPGDVISRLLDFYEAAFFIASDTGREVPHPSGEELFRFYQAYMIAKDTQFRVAPADGRSLSVLLPSVEVSVAVAVMFSIIVATLVVVSVWSLLLGRYGGAGSEKVIAPGIWVPRTKMEWIMEGVREASSREPADELVGASAADEELTERQMRRKVKAEMATAIYGRKGTVRECGKLVSYVAAGAQLDASLAALDFCHVIGIHCRHGVAGSIMVGHVV